MTKLNIEDLNKNIEIAKKIVKHVDEPYRMAVFSIVLNNLTNGPLIKQNRNTNNIKKYANDSDEEINFDDGKKALAKNCKISVDKIDDVINVKDDYIQIIAPLTGKELEKQVKTSLCILAVDEIMFKRQWMPSSLLSKSLDKSGVGDLVHLSRTLNKKSNMIRSKGNKRGTEYKLLGPGRLNAFALIKQLAEKGTA